MNRRWIKLCQNAHFLPKKLRNIWKCTGKKIHLYPKRYDRQRLTTKKNIPWYLVLCNARFSPAGYFYFLWVNHLLWIQSKPQSNFCLILHHSLNNPLISETYLMHSNLLLFIEVEAEHIPTDNSYKAVSQKYGWLSLRFPDSSLRIQTSQPYQSRFRLLHRKMFFR